MTDEKILVCRYCGKIKKEFNKERGLALAKIASWEALGHTKDVYPYLICTDCAKYFDTYFDEDGEQDGT